MGLKNVTDLTCCVFNVFKCCKLVGRYWDTERKYLDENYKTIPFPFDEISTEPFENKLMSTFEELWRYLETWSATLHYVIKNNLNPLEITYDELKIYWQKNDRKVTFPMLLRIGKFK